MKTAVLTVFYPGVEPFLDDYVRCVNGQSDRDFELVVVDDAFPGELECVIDEFDVTCHTLVSNSTPQGNRLAGLDFCKKSGFDVIVCSDADETMYPNRVEKVKQYFFEHAGSDLLFINSVARQENAYFDLYLKSVLYLDDILDFNVLGYGAMNLRASLVPFFLSLANDNVAIFDWWIGLQYLLHFRKVDFRADICNHYTSHADNFVGPALELSKDRIEQSIRIKKNIYAEMLTYCRRHQHGSEAETFRQKLQEIAGIQDYIERHSLEDYFQLVKDYLEGKEKIFWWQEAVSLTELGVAG